MGLRAGDGQALTSSRDGARRGALMARTETGWQETTTGNDNRKRQQEKNQQQEKTNNRKNQQQEKANNAKNNDRIGRIDRIEPKSNDHPSLDDRCLARECLILSILPILSL